jgi:hypothetical protein
VGFNGMGIETSPDYPEVATRLCGGSVVKKSAPRGIRTPVLGLKGPRPGPLDDGGNGRIVPRCVEQGQRFFLCLRFVPSTKYEGAVMA